MDFRFNPGGVKLGNAEKKKDVTKRKRRRRREMKRDEIQKKRGM